MKKKLTDVRKMVQFFAIVFLFLSVVAQLTNLDIKPFWEDEVYTMMRVSGVNINEVKDRISDRLFSSQDSHNLLTSSNSSFRESLSVIKTFPEHSPLYFLALKAWLTVVSENVQNIRLFSVIFNLVSLPLFGWLGYELFGIRIIGWCTLGFASVSPILLRYAQEARPYSMWICLILLSTIFLIRALRADRIIFNKYWLGYAVLIATSFYTHLLSVLLLCTHGGIIGLYSATNLLKKSRVTPQNRNITTASIEKKDFLAKPAITWVAYVTAGLGLAAPWLAFVFKSRQTAIGRTAWLGKASPDLGKLLTAWLGKYTQVVTADLLKFSEYKLTVYLCFLIFLVMSFFYIYRSTKNGLGVITILCFAIIPRLLLVVSDALFGGIRSVISRYAIISFSGTILLLGAAFGLWIYRSTGGMQKALGLAGLLGLWSLSISLGWMSIQAQTWGSLGRWIIDVEAQVSIDNRAILVMESKNYRPAQYLSMLYSLDLKQNAVYLSEDSLENNVLWEKLTLDKASLILIDPSPELQKYSQDLREQSIDSSLFYRANFNLYYLPPTTLRTVFD